MRFILSLWKNVLSLVHFSYCSAFLKTVNGAVQGFTVLVHSFTWAFDRGVAYSVMPFSHLIPCMFSECNLYFANFHPDCRQLSWCIEILTYKVLNSMLILSFIVCSYEFCQVWGAVLHFVMCWGVFLQWKVVSPSPTLLPGELCPMRCLWLLIQIPHHVWRPCSPPVAWGYVICHGNWCTDMNTPKLCHNGLNTVSNVW
jgi:hypothetical protein